jgi:hypothetical protein
MQDARRRAGKQLAQCERVHRGANLAKHAKWSVKLRWQEISACNPKVANGSENNPRTPDSLIQGHLSFLNACPWKIEREWSPVEFGISEKLVEWLDAAHRFPAGLPIHNALFTRCQSETFLKFVAIAIGAI